MWNKALQITALASAISAWPTLSQAVTDEEFRELQEQFNQLADAMENNVATSSNTHLGGYGELHYNNTQSTTGPRKRQADFHRFVLFISHEFNESIRLFTEFELEHALAGEGKPGEVELEQAFIQFDLNDKMNINAGVFLIPVGLLNETHEPNTFYGVERNPIEKNIIPTTWWEGGVMLSGHTDAGISYDVALTTGLDGGTSIRGGRQKIANAKADNLALTARIKYTGIAGLELAATAQRQDDMTQDNFDNVGGATLFETHAVYNTGPITVKGLFATWDIDGDDAKSTNKAVQTGKYIEAAYRLNDDHGVFIRRNFWDNGGWGNTEKTQTDIGYNYWPHENVVVKFDIQSQNVNAGDNDGFNLGIGYQF